MITEVKKIKWLLADDHIIIRQALGLIILEQCPDSIFFHCTNLHQIQATLSNNIPDIAILDAQFPDGNVLKVLPDLRKSYPDLKILIFSSFDEEEYGVRFLKAGANGFLSKLSDEETIRMAVLKILTEHSFLSEKLQSLLLQSIQKPQKHTSLSILTERELQIAELYAKGMGNLEIANFLSLKQNTVSTIKKRILVKLGIHTILELVDLIRVETNLK